jgi:hypothetical protein
MIRMLYRRCIMKNFFKELKDKWDGYLKRLAETNRKLYGNSRLDCCG